MSESVRAVERALDVLLCFTQQTPELSMTQIADQVGIHKSTAHRLLATLEQKRFIQRDRDTGFYRLGIRLVQMAYLTLEQNDLRRLAAPFMHRLCDQYEENIDLAVLDDDGVVFINIFEGSHRVKLAAAIGQRLPAFATASGKAILGFIPEKKVRQIVERGMPQLTPYTLSTFEGLMENLETVRQRGFAISEQELEEQINAIGAPIFDQGKNPIASIAIAGPAYRLPLERMLAIAPNLVATANEISQEVRFSMFPMTAHINSSFTSK